MAMIMRQVFLFKRASNTVYYKLGQLLESAMFV